MTGRAREAIFSSLAPVIGGARVLDLYAGSGSMGLEALSRGAAEAVFVENGREALRVLRTNVASVGLGGKVVAASVERFLAAERGHFHVAFVDPPYGLELASVEEVLEMVVPRLASSATVILHRPSGESPPSVPEGLSLVDERRYGGTHLWRYEKESG